MNSSEIQDRGSIQDLIVQYVSGQISESEAELLLQAIRADQSLFDLLQANVEADFFLDKMFRLDHAVKEHYTDVQTDAIPSVLTPEEWAELLAWERSVKPIDKPDNNLDQIDDPQNLPKVKRAKKRSTSHKKEEKGFPWIFVANTVLLLTIISWAEWFAWQQPKVAADNFVPVAHLVETVDAVWKTDDLAMKRGQAIAAQKISLASGLARINFSNGAHIVLDGPTECVVNDTSGIFCHSGRISAHIPPSAHGFIVHTPFAKVVDRGTDFFVDVQENEMNVETIKGLVELSGPGEQPIPLPAGKGSKLTGIGRPVLKSISSNRYISIENFTTKLLTRISEIKQETEKRNIQLDDDPSVLARFDFNENEKGIVINRSRFGRQFGSDLRFRSCEKTEGAIHDSEAISFNSKKSAGEFNLSGKYPSITIIASIRIDRLDHQGNAIMIGKEYFSEPGSFLWQISREGEILFHLTSEQKNSTQTIASPPVIKKNQWGTWFTLAIVLDARDQVITQYCDGRKISQEKWEHPIPLTFGGMMIGNILDKNISTRERTLGGAIGELMIYNKALSEDDLKNNRLLN